MTCRSRFLAAFVLAGLVAGCSSHTDDLNGTWTGTDTLSNGTTLQNSVTLTADNSTVSGTIAANTTVGVVVYTGTITGTYNAPTFTFTMTVAQGGVVNQPNCSLQFNGSGTFVGSNGSTSPSKTLAGTFTTTP